MSALERFIEGDDVRTTPASIRIGFSKAEWLALTPDDRRTYIRAVLKMRARQRQQGH